MERLLLIVFFAVFAWVIYRIIRLVIVGERSQRHREGRSVGDDGAVVSWWQAQDGGASAPISDDAGHHAHSGHGGHHGHGYHEAGTTSSDSGFPDTGSSSSGGDSGGSSDAGGGG